MFKLRSLIENYPNSEIHYDIQEMTERVANEWQSGQKHQSWRLVPKRLLELTWMTFAKYGRVNEKALSKIWEMIKENAFKIIINSEVINGLHNDEFFGKYDDTEKVTDEEWEKFSSFISDRSDRAGTTRSDSDAYHANGYGRYSDAHNRLFKLVENAYKTETPEEKLIAIDQILNFVHGIGYMADWFVEGGVNSLIDLRDKDVKGIHLTGRLSEDMDAPEVDQNEPKTMRGKNFIVVDVQPEYQKNIPFIRELIRFIHENHESLGRLIFLYNGADTLGMIDETSYKMWWMENGLDENIIDQADFYDKGYAFFRYCMDSSSMSDDTIANFVRFMDENNIRDSREMTREMWAKYLRQYRRTDRKEVMELLQHADDCVHVPDLMDYLRRFNNVVLCGGGVNECLKEVEIAMLALRKPYDIESRFTY